MKMLMMGLMVVAFAIISRGDVFQMDRKGDATVEVQKSANEYKVKCKFRPQTKFDKAINAKFNDAKGDSLCKKGLARYLKVATNESFVVSGLYSAALVETIGDRLCYSFAVPVSGCKVLKADADTNHNAAVNTNHTEATENPVVAAGASSKHVVEPKEQAVVDLETPKEAPKESTSAVVRTSSFLCVAKYKEVNGTRKTISRREYQGYNFKSPRDFDRFCQEEFARIRAQGDANLRAVRNFGK